MCYVLLLCTCCVLFVESVFSKFLIFLTLSTYFLFYFVYISCSICVYLSPILYIIALVFPCIYINIVFIVLLYSRISKLKDAYENHTHTVYFDVVLSPKLSCGINSKNTYDAHHGYYSKRRKLSMFSSMVILIWT